MALPAILQNLSVPVIASPLFIISNPDLVIAQCKAGIVGSFPSLNARSADIFESWLQDISEATQGEGCAPFAVNLIVHKSNNRLEEDLALCEKYQVPIIITSTWRERGRQSPHHELWRHRVTRHHQQPVRKESDRKGWV